MSTLKVNRIEPRTGDSVEIVGLEIPESPVKAWVNFNGTGAVAIREEMNVSSITDNEVGGFTVNFKTPMPDANYSTIGTTGEDPITFGYSGSPTVANESQSTTSVNIKTGYSDAGGYMLALDWENTCIGVFR